MNILCPLPGHWRRLIQTRVLRLSLISFTVDPHLPTKKHHSEPVKKDELLIKIMDIRNSFS